jgi:chromosome segregation ATPase
MRRTANALAVEPNEVPVISNELLEANVASIRIDLTDLKAEVRLISEKADGAIRTAVARIDEQFREVRQDIRELRADNKTLRDKIDENYSSLDRKIDTACASLSAKIDGNGSCLDRKIDTAYASLSGKIDGNYSCLDRKIDTTYASLSAKVDGNYSSLDKKIDTEVGHLRADMKEMHGEIKSMSSSISDLKAMQKAILWVVGSVSFVASIVTIARMLQWI